MERDAFAKSFQFPQNKPKISWITVSRRNATKTSRDATMTSRNATIISRSTSLSVAKDPCFEEIKLGFSLNNNGMPQISLIRRR
jgi:hypothetical protein